jgi:mono/diheme cytochrome c family protein
MHRIVMFMGVPLVVLACSAKTSNVPSPPLEPPAIVSQVTTPSVAKSTSMAEDGERIYSANCVPCHQQSGVGIPGVYPSLAGSAVVLGDPQQWALWVVKGQRPASMPAGRYSTMMLQFGWMKAADAAALLNYLRANFGNAAPPVDIATLAAVLGQ